MCRDKLLRLRSLYMSQFERLKHVYKNKKRKYLLATSANDEGLTGKLLQPPFSIRRLCCRNIIVLLFCKTLTVFRKDFGPYA